MSLLIVGSVAIDSIKTPWGRVDEVLGGSATYAALASRLWTPTSMVAVVGSDFPKTYSKFLHKYGLNGGGLEQVPGKTFRWKGQYDQNLQAQTLFLDLGVFQEFRPKLSPTLQKIPYAFLGNIHPSLQWSVLRQMKAPRLVACDSRDDWIKNNRAEFLALLKRMDILFLNDSEARLLTGIHGLVQATKQMARMGPKVAVVKKGEHGVLVASKDAFFSLPSYPVTEVVDPTGAGDTFAGTCLGVLASQRQMSWSALCRAIQYASVVASITIEDFGPARLAPLTKGEILGRWRSYQSIARMVHLPNNRPSSGRGTRSSPMRV